MENSRTNFFFWTLSFLSLIILRILVEGWIDKFRDRSSYFILYEFAHNFLFFLIAYILFLAIIKKLVKTSFSSISNVLLWGYLIILTPPIVDHIISKGKGFWSFYKFDGITGLIQRFFTLFGDKPEIGITYGVRFEVVAVVFLIFIYSFIKLKKISKSLAVAALSYLILFVLGTFPSYVTILTKGFSKGFLNVGEIDIAQMFLVPFNIFSRDILDVTNSFNLKMSIIYSILFSVIILIGIFIYQRKKLISFLENIRLPQVIYHAGLVSCGLGLGIILNSDTQKINASIFNYFNLFNALGFLVLVESVIMAWLASVIINDFIDIKIDRKTNASRPLICSSITEKEYCGIGIILFLFSLFFSAIISVKIMLLLVAYQAVAWLYSSWPMRLKRFAFISTFVSGIASLLIFFSGYILVSDGKSIAEIPASIMMLLVIGYTLSLPIKDFKDIEGDKEDGVFTIPVIFGEYWGKIIVGSGVFLSFLLSVVFLRESSLFWWALIFGGISFWLIVKMSAKGITVPSEKKDPSQGSINYQNIFWWIMGVVFLYGIILVKIVFL